MRKMIVRATTLFVVFHSIAGAQMRAGWIDVGDARLNYQISGRGEPVVFIHGWANDLSSWRDQVAVFSKQYRVLTYDRRGYGRSTAFADATADPTDLLALLDSLGIRRAHIVGHSAGARAALQFALAFPNRVDALVLYGASPLRGFMGAAPSSINFAQFIGIARQHGLDSLRKFLWTSELVWMPRGSENIYARLDTMWSRYSGRDLLEEHQPSNRVPVPSMDDLVKLHAPTLFVTGDHEMAAFREFADTAIRRLPNARRVVIANAGHGAHWAQPAAFNAALLTFFAGVHDGVLASAPGEGFVTVPGGKLWYRVVGSGPRTPLLVVHGCCGVGSYYLKPLEALADERPVVFYDMIDNGRSDHPGDTTLWRMEHFADEIARVRDALGLREIHLYGHSFGANVVTDYILTKPKGVKSLTLAGAEIDMTRAAADMEARFRSLPDSVQAAILNNEKAGTINSPQYMAAVFEFLHRFHARRLPWSADVDSSVAHINWPMGAYMYGPKLVELGGVMKSYDRTAQLPSIRTPTLITIGEYDYTTPETARDLQKLIRDSRLVIVANSGHLMMHDDPEGHVRTMRDFLHATEKR